jgi:hypothetical protein
LLSGGFYEIDNIQRHFFAAGGSPCCNTCEGASGTLKSGLCFSLMLDLLKDPNKFGIYITLEQSGAVI